MSTLLDYGTLHKFTYNKTIIVRILILNILNLIYQVDYIIPNTFYAMQFI